MVAKAVRYQGGEDGIIQQQPFWLMLVIPYATPDSLDRTKIFERSAGFTVVSEDGQTSKEILENTILLDSEITQWSMQTSKTSHVGGLQCQCQNSVASMQILQWVVPGDHCLFWAFDNMSDYLRIKSRLIDTYKAQQVSPAFVPKSDNSDVVNDYYSGLKFIGKISSVRVSESRSPDGDLGLGTTIQAQSFTELDATIYYNDLIRHKYNDSLQFYNDLGITLDQIFRDDAESRGAYVNNNVLVPALLQILLGQGPGSLTIDKAGSTVGVPNSGLRDTPNVQYEVPKLLGQMVHSGSGSRQTQFYSDILTMLIGIHEYQENSPNENSPWEFLLPRLQSVTPQVATTNKPLDDKIIVLPFDFRDRSVWEILQGYLNKPLNEIYTAIRPFPGTGRLRSTFIMRRVPLSTDQYISQSATSPGFMQGTGFTTLPVWMIPSIAIQSYDLGRSEAQRINYVHVVGTDPISRDRIQSEQIAMVMGPPIVDETSIKRNGLRMYAGKVPGYTVRGSSTSNDNVSQKYTAFMSDILMDGHLRYSGTISCLGIQEPVAPGDNICINGIIFHIEDLTHTGGIDASGKKHFTTSVQGSHGLPVAAINKSKANTQKLANTEEEKSKTSDSAAKENLERLASQLRRSNTNLIRDERNDRTDLKEIKLLGGNAEFTPDRGEGEST